MVSIPKSYPSVTSMLRRTGLRRNYCLANLMYVVCPLLRDSIVMNYCPADACVLSPSRGVQVEGGCMVSAIVRQSLGAQWCPCGRVG